MDKTTGVEKGVTPKRNTEKAGDQPEIWFSPIPDETKPKRGRLTSAERFTRARSVSEGSPFAQWKRIFGEVEQTNEPETAAPFKRSTITKHSPKKGDKEEGNSEGDKNEKQDNEDDPGNETEMEERMIDLFGKMLAGVKEEILTEVRMIGEQGKEGRKEMKQELESVKNAVDRSRIECEEGRERLESRIVNIEKEIQERDREDKEKWERKELELQQKIEQEVSKAVEGNRGAEGNREGASGAQGGSEIETREKIRELENTMERNERKEKRNNIVVKGLRVEQNRDIKREVRTFIEEVAGKEVELEVIRELQGKGRSMFLARFREFEDKRIVMQRKRALKGRTAFIDNDLTKKEREIQGILVEKMKKEREAGKRARVGYMKLWIENKEYHWNEDREELEEKENFRIEGEAGESQKERRANNGKKY